MRRRSAPSGVAACRRRTRGQRSEPKPGKRLRASVAQLDPVTSPFLRRKARRASKSDSGIHSGPKLPQRELFSRRHTDTRLVAECNTWLWREGMGGEGEVPRQPPPVTVRESATRQRSRLPAVFYSSSSTLLFLRPARAGPLVKGLTSQPRCCRRRSKRR